jgi:hypothetical protein
MTAVTSRYFQMKRDTDELLTWLGRTAIANGYSTSGLKLASSSSGPSKAAKKNAKRKAKAKASKGADDVPGLEEENGLEGITAGVEKLNDGGTATPQPTSSVNTPHTPPKYIVTQESNWWRSPSTTWTRRSISPYPSSLCFRDVSEPDCGL